MSRNFTDSSLGEKFEGCLSQQLIEYELLQSMYPNQGEIVLTDRDVLQEISTFLNKKSESKPRHLDFTLNLFINKKVKLEICINLPTEYPEEEPDIYLRCNQLNRQQETQLNLELIEFIKQNYIKGEVCLYTVISWLQEHMADYKFETVQLNNIAIGNDQSKCHEVTFQRIWIFSHHIYNKKKKEEIIKNAKDLSLTGFCLPGKPGVICVEGDNAACLEWWKTVKSMTWKKIMIRKTETFQITEAMSARKFSNFNELRLKMADFSKYMNELGFGQIFNEFFGLGNES